VNRRADVRGAAAPASENSDTVRLILRLPPRANGFSGVSGQGLLLSGLVHFGAIVALLMLSNQHPPAPNRLPVTTVMLVAGGRLVPPGRPAASPPTPVPAAPAKRPEPPPSKAVQKPPSPEKPAPKPSPSRQHPAEPRSEPAAPLVASPPAAPDPAPATASAGSAGSAAAGFAPDLSGGDPGGVPSIDSAAFPFAYYRALITNRLRAAWSRPTVPGGLSGPIRATVRFEILRGGALVDISLGSPSGHPPLDRSALRAAYDANPLPPLPDEFEGDRLAVNFYFELLPEP